jgi:hypothetical protein
MVCKKSQTLEVGRKVMGRRRITYWSEKERKKVIRGKVMG